MYPNRGLDAPDMEPEASAAIEMRREINMLALERAKKDGLSIEQATFLLKCESPNLFRLVAYAEAIDGGATPEQAKRIARDGGLDSASIMSQIVAQIKNVSAERGIPYGEAFQAVHRQNPHLLRGFKALVQSEKEAALETDQAAFEEAGRKELARWKASHPPLTLRPLF